MHYRCINFNEICFQLFNNCSKTKNLQCIENIQNEYSCQCPRNICEYDHRNQLVGFIDKTCLSETFQGIYWPKTFVNKGQYVSCPYPCTGMIY